MSSRNDAGAIRFKLHLTSPPERVYEALATAAGRARFWAEAAPENGGTITFHFPDHAPHAGRILHREPPHRFAVEYFGAETEFRLHPDGRGGTDLELVARGVSEPERTEIAAGWVSVLMALKAAVDHGVDLRNHDPARCWQTGYADN